MVLLLWRDTMTKGIFKKKALNWGLAYSFKGLVHYHHGRKHDSMQAGMDLRACILICRQQAERNTQGTSQAFETSKLIPSDTPPPTRPHLLILPEQFYTLVTKHWNRWAHRDHSHSNHHSEWRESMLQHLQWIQCYFKGFRILSHLILITALGRGEISSDTWGNGGTEEHFRCPKVPQVQSFFCLHVSL